MPIRSMPSRRWLSVFALGLGVVLIGLAPALVVAAGAQAGSRVAAATETSMKTDTKREASARPEASTRPRAKANPDASTKREASGNLEANAMSELETQMLVTPQVQSDVLSELARLLEDLYVIPDMAQSLIAMLQETRAGGRYDSLSDPIEFARALTDDMQALSGDKHLRVMFGESIPQQVVVVRRDPENEGGDAGPAGPMRIVRRVAPGAEPGGASGAGPGGASGAESGAGARILSGSESAGPVAPGSARHPGEGSDGGVFERSPGIAEAKVLPGNVGYVDIRMFKPLDRAGAREEAARAMKTVEDADALVFDLRMCSGGSPDMVHFLTSYLFPPEPKLLLTYYHAHEEPEQAFTLREIPGRRMPDVPVFVLTSPMTASGGEEFGYGLEHHGRATLIGETTAGAAHGGGVHPVAAGFHAFVPDFRPVHPVTGGDWEGVGVVPDVRVDYAKALSEAHVRALEVLIDGAPSSTRRDALRSTLAEVRAAEEEQAMRAQLGEESASEYVGRFEYRTISAEDGVLYLQRDGGPKLELIPSGAPDEFTLDLVPSAKIRFERNGAGVVDALHVLAMSGNWEVTRRE